MNFADVISKRAIVWFQNSQFCFQIGYFCHFLEKGRGGGEGSKFQTPPPLQHCSHHYAQEERSLFSNTFYSYYLSQYLWLIFSSQQPLKLLKVAQLNLELTSGVLEYSCSHGKIMIKLTFFLNVKSGSLSSYYNIGKYLIIIPKS